MKILKFGILALAIGLGACATQPQNTALLSSACASAAVSLQIATGLDAQAKLTPAQRNTVDIAAAAINGPCSQANAPTDLSGALASVAAATTSLIPILGAK